MFVKISIVVAVLGLIQAVQCETAAEVLAEYKPKIQELSLKANLAQQESCVELRNATALMQKNVNEGYHNAYIYLGKMKALVGEAIKEAQASGKDIKICIMNLNHAIVQLNWPALYKCNQCNQLSSVYKSINTLRKLSGRINIIPSVCVLRYPTDSQTDELRNCIDEGMQTSEQVMITEQNSITTQLQEAVNKTEECVENVVNNIITTIDEIWNDFQNCVELVEVSPE